MATINAFGQLPAGAAVLTPVPGTTVIVPNNHFLVLRDWELESSHLLETLIFLVQSTDSGATFPTVLRVLNLAANGDLNINYGSMGVYSVLGVGTTVRLRLEAVQAGGVGRLSAAADFQVTPNNM